MTLHRIAHAALERAGDLSARLRRHTAKVAALVLPVVIASSTAQVSTMPVVDLSIGPVAVNAQAVNIALALSVEFPTVGAAYRNTTYDHNTTYLGYWDPAGCYDYKDTTTGAPLAGEYFYRTGSVDSNRYCNTAGAGTGYSGNVLNYVATSSIDLLRYALTGGNRVADTGSATVLERAYLYNGWQLHDGTYFPAKRIPSNLEGLVTPDYSGTGDVYGGGCLDRVWFGRSNASANCTSPGTSGNLNKPVFDTSNTTTVVVNNGAAAPSSSVFVTTIFQISNPLRTSTVAPLEGPVSFDDIIVLGAGTSTTAVPGNPPGSFVTTQYIVTGTTTTAPPAGAPDTSVQGYLTTTATRYSTVNPGVGLGAAFSMANTSGNRFLNICQRSGVYVGPYSSGTPGSASNSFCSGLGSGWSRVSVNGNITLPATFYALYGTTPFYKAYTTQNVYRTYSTVRVYDVYDKKDQYIQYGLRPGDMFARVRVCDSAEAATRTDLCQRYPNGNYKPVGEIQRRAEGAKVAAFGYLADDNTSRYGGVLRAPMRFTGPQYRDPNGQMVSNAAPEWDVNSGVFATDPLGASPTYARSGVINYLNKFGTTGTPGYYKSYDPVGELYYEALRYYQGLGPTSTATASLSAGMYDGFPIYNTVVSATSTTPGWRDPVGSACERRNFILAIGDVNTWNDRQLPGHGSGASSGLANAGDPARPAEAIPGSTRTFNVVEWTALLTGFETGANRSYVDALGRSQNTTGNPNTYSNNTNLEGKGTGASNAAYYWAGAAYWANTQPIRLDVKGGQSMRDVRVKTFTIDVDEGGNGSIEDSNPRGTKPRASSFYLAGKYGWFNDANLDGNPFRTSGGVTNNTEWQDADAPNTPDGYVIASQAQKMIEGIRKFFQAATSEKGAVSVSSLSSQRFTTQSPNGDLFAPRFDTRDWSGTVQRSSLRLNTSTGSIDTVAGVRWDAGALLTAASITLSPTVADPYVKPADRKIITMSRDSGVMTGQAFTVANKGNLDSEVRTALATNPVTTTTDGLDNARIGWLRGERTDEQSGTGGTLRRRNSIMGDIINSGPVFKQGADPNTIGPGYTEFASGVAGRTAMIYVGANDGMLHALRAEDGKELFAYIPRAVASNLHHLTNPNYVHRPYVDGVPQVSEAQVGGSWRTLLVSGMGGGAQGVFALDVTSPTTFTTTNVMWEFTDRDDADMGNVLTQPKLVKLKVSSSGTPQFKWFVAVSSGYNNYRADGYASSTGRQALFLLSVDKAANQPWTLNTNYFKFVVADPASTTAANGLANPGVITGSAGETLMMYAGDLQGNVWRFNFCAGLTSSSMSSIQVVASGVPLPLFVAMDGSSNRQPITTSPLITRGLDKGYMVVFGTGKFVEPSDSASAMTQSIYGVWDPMSSASADYAIQRNKLFQRTLQEGTATTTISGSATFVFGDGSGSTYRGWYFDLTQTRERIAVEGAIGLGFVAMNSTIPDGSCSGDGTGRPFCMNPLFGNASCEIQLTSAGLLSRPNVVQISTEEESVGLRNNVGKRRANLSQGLISTGTKITDAGNVASVTSKANIPTAPAGRVGWREVRDFKEN